MELTAAEPRRKGLVQLYIDGEPAVKIDNEVLLLSRIKPGDELTDEELPTPIEPKRRPCTFWSTGTTRKKS